MTGYISNLCNLLKKVKKFLGVYFKKTGNISLPHKELILYHYNEQTNTSLKTPPWFGVWKPYRLV
jgi:hypothetical protein